MIARDRFDRFGPALMVGLIAAIVVLGLVFAIIRTHMQYRIDDLEQLREQACSIHEIDSYPRLRDLCRR